MVLHGDIALMKSTRFNNTLAARLHREGRKDELWVLGMDYVDRVVGKLSAHKAVHDSEEAKQNGYLALGMAIDDWDPEVSPFTTYMWIRVRGFVLNEARAQEMDKGMTALRYQEDDVHYEDSDQLPADWEGNYAPDSGYVSLLKSELVGSISMLIPKQSNVIHLRYMKDMTQREVAELLGISVRYVRQLEKEALYVLKSVWS